MVGRFLAIAAIGYLLGSCNGAILISRVFLRDDVREHGSGNAGLTNFYRSYGGVLTLLVIAIDLGKVFLACWLGRVLGEEAWLPEYTMMGGTAAIIGHMFPLYFDLRGGKGILSTGAVALFMDWRMFLILFGLFLLLVLLTRYVSLGSIVAAALYPVMFLLFFPGRWGLVVLALVGWYDVWRHKANIRRLLSGTESKFSFHRS